MNLLTMEKTILMIHLINNIALNLMILMAPLMKNILTSHKKVGQMKMVKISILLFKKLQIQMFKGFQDILGLVLTKACVWPFKGCCFSRILSVVWFLTLTVFMNLINPTFLKDKTKGAKVSTKFWSQKKRLRSKQQVLTMWAEWSQEHCKGRVKSLRPKSTTNHTSWSLLRIKSLARWICLSTFMDTIDWL